MSTSTQVISDGGLLRCIIKMILSLCVYYTHIYILQESTWQRVWLGRGGAAENKQASANNSEGQLYTAWPRTHHCASRSCWQSRSFLESTWGTRWLFSYNTIVFVFMFPCHLISSCITYCNIKREYMHIKICIQYLLPFLELLTYFIYP